MNHILLQSKHSLYFGLHTVAVGRSTIDLPGDGSVGSFPLSEPLLPKSAEAVRPQWVAVKLLFVLAGLEGRVVQDELED